MANLQSTSVTGSLTLGNTPNTSATGYIWFDTTANQIKYTVDTVGTSDTFSSGGVFPTGANGVLVTGNSKDALAITGFTPNGQTYRYNGTSWATDVASAFQQCAHSGGTANSTIFNNGNCGYNYYYDGLGFALIGDNNLGVCAKTTGGPKSWLTVGSNTTTTCCSGLDDSGNYSIDSVSSVINARCRFLLNGTSWDAVNKMGGAILPTYHCDMEQFDGTSWSAGPNMIHERYSGVSTGTQNNTWALGGTPTADSDCTTEKYDGVSWSAGPTIQCFYNNTVGYSGQGTAGSSLYIHTSGCPTAICNTCEINAPYTGVIVTCTC